MTLSDRGDSELQYRVEVQNRVYRREMAQLELELARLEKQLAQEPVEPSHASSSASIPQRNPSIGGGLPLLLLSVLPPVIPRASWPSADSSGEWDSFIRHSSCKQTSPIFLFQPFICTMNVNLFHRGEKEGSIHNRRIIFSSFRCRRKVTEFRLLHAILFERSYHRLRFVEGIGN